MSQKTAEGLTVGIHRGNRQATGRKLWVATSRLHQDREYYTRRPLVNPHGEAAGEGEEEAWASSVFPSRQTNALPPRVCSCSHRTNYYTKSSTESLYQLGDGEYIITYITAEAGLVVGVKIERERQRGMNGQQTDMIKSLAIIRDPQRCGTTPPPAPRMCEHTGGWHLPASVCSEQERELNQYFQSLRINPTSEHEEKPVSSHQYV